MNPYDMIKIVNLDVDAKKLAGLTSRARSAAGYALDAAGLMMANMEDLAIAGAFIVAEMERVQWRDAVAASTAATAAALNTAYAAPGLSPLQRRVDAAAAARDHDPDLSRQLLAEVAADHAKAVAPKPLTGAWPRTREEHSAARAQAADRARRDELARRAHAAHAASPPSSVYESATPPPSDDFTFETVGRGFHSGRQQYRVTCRQCGEVVHDQTTAPETRADEHARICTAVGKPRALHLFIATESDTGNRYYVSAYDEADVPLAVKANNEVDDWDCSSFFQLEAISDFARQVDGPGGVDRTAREWAAEGRGVVGASLSTITAIHERKTDAPEIDWKISRPDSVSYVLDPGEKAVKVGDEQALGRGVKSPSGAVEIAIVRESDASQIDWPKIGDMVGADASRRGAAASAIERAAETVLSIGKEKPDGEVEIRVHKSRAGGPFLLAFGPVVEQATAAIDRNIRAARALLMPADKRAELGKMMASASSRRWDGQCHELLEEGLSYTLLLLSELADAVENCGPNFGPSDGWEREKLAEKLGDAKGYLQKLDAGESACSDARRLASSVENLLRMLTDLAEAVEHAEFDTALEDSPWDRENVRQKLAAAKKLLGLP